MVSLGRMAGRELGGPVAQVANASPKMVWPSRTRSWTLERGRLEVQVALGVVEVHEQLLVGAVDALELVDEVHVPGGPPELPVGDALQPKIALHGDDLVDAPVLDLTQRLGVDPPGLVVGSGCV